MTTAIQTLVVEDNPADADLIRAYLAEIDDISCDLEHVQRLEPALKLLEERQFDLVLLDAFLPDSAGPETFERTEGVTSDTPVIVLTGGDDPELERRALRHGAAGFIPKNALDSDLLARRIRHALERPADWPSPLRINVNLSPAQLARNDAVSHLTSLLQDAAPQNIRFCLEITEAQLLERRDRVGALSEAGFPIIVDDFGTGYSSLTRIKELPMDELKLDMEFVQGAVEHSADRAILETVTELGRQLGVPVVGEGVETEAQLDLLRRAGCTAAQGYLLEHPGPISELMASAESVS
jgi:EAL domain-containing protein (putative c-di-GMP-specific phosphodiesterase class I)